MPLRKESKRGLIALAVLCVVGLATFASVASSTGPWTSSIGSHWTPGSSGADRAKDAVAARPAHAQ